jgi:hypothetical protein
MTALVISDLTQSTLEGTGVFDTLMRANKTHLEAEFSKNRIKGAEYATVYLGSLDSVMRTSMEFLLQKQRIGLEAQLLEQQILLAQVGVLKANAELAIVNASLAKIPLELAQLTAQTELVNAQKANTIAELAIIQANALKVPAEIAHLQAQTAVTTQQKLNLTAEAINIPKQGLQLDAQIAVTTQQKLNLISENFGIVAKTDQTTQQTNNLLAEAANIPKQGTVLDKQALQVAQQTANLVAEAANLPKQGLKIEADTQVAINQRVMLVSENLAILARTGLVNEQMESEASRNYIHPTDALSSGAVEQERRVLLGQKCKLDAEFDVLMEQKIKSASENALLLQKVETEKAQTTALGVDDNSVIGRQKALYVAQSDGFKRDAEQKAAKILIDTWNVRKTTDPDDPSLHLPVSNDNISSAVNKLILGITA